MIHKRILRAISYWSDGRVWQMQRHNKQVTVTLKVTVTCVAGMGGGRPCCKRYQYKVRMPNKSFLLNPSMRS